MHAMIPTSAIPFEGFYASITSSSLEALRLLEAGFSAEDRSITGHTVLPDGTCQVLFMSEGTVDDNGIMRKTLSLAKLATEWDFEPQEPCPLVHLSWRAAEDEIVLKPAEGLAEFLREAQAAPAGTPAHIAVDFVQIISMMTGMDVWDSRPVGRQAFCALACHASVAKGAMEAMTQLPAHERPQRLAALMLDVAALHECFETACNAGANGALNRRIDALSAGVAARLAGTGITKYRIGSDPRGSTLDLQCVGGSKIALTAWPIRLLQREWNQLRCALRSAADKSLAAPAASTAAPVVAAAPDLRETIIAESVLNVLRASRLEGARLYLPPGLPRARYQEVNAAIELAGGKWNRSAGAHVFKAPAAQEKFARLLASGTVLDPKSYDFFATPDAAAAEVVALAEVEPGMLVADPGAGRGAIAAHLARIVGAGNVHAFELLPEHTAVLREMGLQVTEGDFLQQPGATVRPDRDESALQQPGRHEARRSRSAHAAPGWAPGGHRVARVRAP